MVAKMTKGKMPAFGKKMAMAAPKVAKAMTAVKKVVPKMMGKMPMKK